MEEKIVAKNKKSLKAYKTISIILSILSFITFIIFEIGKSILKEPISNFLGELVDNYSYQELNAELTRLYFNDPETLKSMGTLIKINNICNKATIPLILCVIFVAIVIIISLYQKKQIKENISDDTSQQVISQLAEQKVPDKSHKAFNGTYTVICMVISIIYFIICAILALIAIVCVLLAVFGDDLDFSQLILCISLSLVFLIGGLLLLPFIKKIIDKHTTNKMKKIFWYTARFLFIPIAAVITRLITFFI